jgi:hypothetical protein
MSRGNIAVWYRGALLVGSHTKWCGWHSTSSPTVTGRFKLRTLPSPSTTRTGSQLYAHIHLHNITEEADPPPAPREPVFFIILFFLVTNHKLQKTVFLLDLCGLIHMKILSLNLATLSPSALENILDLQQNKKQI